VTKIGKRRAYLVRLAAGIMVNNESEISLGVLLTVLELVSNGHFDVVAYGITFSGE